MSTATEAITIDGSGGSSPFWILITSYAFARVLQVYPGKTPMLVVVALHVLPPCIFAIWHGARLYGRRGILAFVVICLGLGSAFEILGTRTGVPFGRYYFTDVMGPKVFSVPVLLALAYVGMAYLSWILATLILGPGLRRRSVLTLPLLAALIMVGWDVSQDPVWSTVLHAWIWLDAGRYFGVPLTNFLGWYLTVYLIFQSFALYLTRYQVFAKSMRRGFWRQAVLFYAAFAAGNLILLLPNGRAPIVWDATGIQWRVRNIVEACAVVTVFIMGAFFALAWSRLSQMGRA